MAIRLDTTDALRVLVGWVADPFVLSVERAGGDEAHGRKKCKSLTHLDRLECSDVRGVVELVCSLEVD